MNFWQNLSIPSARRLIEGSKGAYFCLVFLKKQQIIAPWGWGPGSGDLSQKAQTYPCSWCHTQKTQIQNISIFYWKYKSYWIFSGFQELCSSGVPNLSL